jgi:hypothetical protein
MTAAGENQSAETAKQFAARMIETIDNAAATLLISIGHQTHLFEPTAHSRAFTR